MPKPYGDSSVEITKLVTKATETTDSASAQRSPLGIWESYLYPVARVLWVADCVKEVVVHGQRMQQCCSDNTNITKSSTRNSPDGCLFLRYSTFLQSSSPASYNISLPLTLYHPGAPAAHCTASAMTPTCVTSFRWSAPA